MIVIKFGGTSVGSAPAMTRVAAIIKSRVDRRPVVVVSAMSGITNKLVLLGREAAQKKSARVEEIVQELRDRHRRVIAELGIHSLELDQLIEETITKCQKLSEKIANAGDMVKHLNDELLSYGEYLSAHIVAACLRNMGADAIMVDVRDVLLTDSQFGQAQPLIEESIDNAKKILLPQLDMNRIPILQGFVGRDMYGRTTTLGRGGSDYTATLIGAMLEATEVEIWSDVDGVLTADPAIIPEAKRIRVMTFQEAAELAYFGAKVLHPATLLPAIDRNIPVYVLNSLRPDDSGTKIHKHQENSQESCVVKSIAYKEGLSVITVHSTRMLMAYGFLSSIFDVFNANQTSVDLVSTSEVSVSITIDNTDKLSEITRALNRFARIEIEHHKAIVCIVGAQVKRTAGMPGKIFNILYDTPIHMISQGASEINISFVIDEIHIAMVVKRLHDYFFTGSLDPAVFAV